MRSACLLNNISDFLDPSVGHEISPSYPVSTEAPSAGARTYILTRPRFQNNKSERLKLTTVSQAALHTLTESQFHFPEGHHPGSPGYASARQATQPDLPAEPDLDLGTKAKGTR